jgi:hypothetical protein
MPPRPPRNDDKPPTAPLTQKQEDLLIELFVQLSVADRRKVIKFCRDLRKASRKPTR